MLQGSWISGIGLDRTVTIVVRYYGYEPLVIRYVTEVFDWKRVQKPTQYLGSIAVPDVLQPYMGGVKVIEHVR